MSGLNRAVPVLTDEEILWGVFSMAQALAFGTKKSVYIQSVNSSPLTQSSEVHYTSYKWQPLLKLYFLGRGQSFSVKLIQN